jgi:Kef-type K+ transport system membrane component KefB
MYLVLCGTVLLLFVAAALGTQSSGWLPGIGAFLGGMAAAAFRYRRARRREHFLNAR